MRKGFYPPAEEDANYCFVFLQPSEVLDGCFFELR